MPEKEGVFPTAYRDGAVADPVEVWQSGATGEWMSDDSGHAGRWWSEPMALSAPSSGVGGEDEAMNELCEWDPMADGPAMAGADGSNRTGCWRDAAVSLGSDGEWHLCAECAALPEFSRFKVCKPLPERSQ